MEASERWTRKYGGEAIEAAVNNNSAQCGTTAPCFANVTAANASVSATNPGSAVTTLTNLCAGAGSTYTLPTASTGSIIIGVIAAGGNGTAGTGVFPLPNPVNNVTVASDAWQLPWTLKHCNESGNRDCNRRHGKPALAHQPVQAEM